MTSERTTVTVAEIERTVIVALTYSGTLPENASPVARAMARAEAEGNGVCGLFYLPIFCSHVECGKVDGKAEPLMTSAKAAVAVDARHGFAHPAIEAGLPHLAAAAKSLGVAALGVRNSYNCLALGHHVRPLAEQGLIGLCMANAPASVAPRGATRPIFGTNPLAFAVPTADGGIILVDQSMSAVTKTEMVRCRQRGDPIPLGWAQDRDGQPTTNAAEGLSGSLLPAGGQKGANVMLIIEILTAALTGSKLSVEASMFGDDEGDPPGTGQFLLAIDPAQFGDGFASSLGRLAESLDAAGVRLPGRQQNSLLTDWADAPIEMDADIWIRAINLSRRA